MTDEDDDSGSEMSGTPNVINVDQLRNGKQDSGGSHLFPRRLVKRHKLEVLRRAPSLKREQNYSVPPIRVQSLNRSEQVSYRRPQTNQGGPIYMQPPPPQPVAVKEKIKVVHPPPMYIRAPKPKVIVMKEQPKVVQTPPQVIR